MDAWVYILAGVVVLFFVIRAKKKALGTPILKTKIGTRDGLNYIVEFEKIHPEIKKIEYVRLALNYVAKILFIIEKKDDHIRRKVLDHIKK